jgi:RNA polymerase sigma-70 factor (ECF subfamily)
VLYETMLAGAAGSGATTQFEPAAMTATTAAGRGSLPAADRSTEDLFEALFAQYEQAIYQYVYRLLGDPEDARDFTQDAFFKAYRKLPETLAKGNFQPQAWLYRIATNVCLDELRHRSLLKWQPWEAFVTLFHPSQVARDNPERDALQAETRHEVERVLEKLPPRYRTALILREYHGLGYEEIAHALGTSRTAVKTLLLRAREAFRLHYARLHPKLAAQARGPRVLPRVLGRPAAA